MLEAWLREMAETVLQSPRSLPEHRLQCFPQFSLAGRRNAKNCVCVYQLWNGGAGLRSSMPTWLCTTEICCGNVAWQVAAAGADMALGHTRIVLSDVQDISLVDIYTFRS